MKHDDFNKVIEQNQPTIDRIRALAHKAHADVNQHYDKVLPYSVHIDSVADFAKVYGAEVCQSPDDVVPILFGAYFHDTIEDARLTYNNVLSLARELMTEQQALLATEIVYALTNEKGRNRAERANDKYYAGIRSTPYAPLCKFADRLANVTFSTNKSEHSQYMKGVYAEENAHFVESVATADITADPRLKVPQQMIDQLASLLN